jgi:Flp pilus assembly protein TadD
MTWPIFGKYRFASARLRPLMIVGTFLVLLAGCDTVDKILGPDDGVPAQFSAIKTNLNLSKIVPLNKLDNEPRQLAAQGIQALDENRLADASKLFNQALSLDISNSYLQFLNGYAYHLIGDLDDTSKYPLAKAGYDLAIKFDPTNWVARYYRGMLQLQEKDYSGAQKTFADAILYKNDDLDLLYRLAYSSYYARDPVSAAGALKRLRELKKNDPRSLKASAIVMAALNEKEASQNYLRQYASLTKNPSQIQQLNKRLKDWQRFHRHMGKIQLAQFGDPSAGGDVGGDPGAGGDAGAGGEGGEGGAAAGPKKMVIVDVVILRTEENITSNKGVNLLNGLRIQFGVATGGGFVYQNNRSDNGKVTGGSTTKISKSFAINNSNPNYSLNIANANTSRNEILARPTIIALSGQESNFFSGNAITATAVGSSGSGATLTIEKEIGIKLAVTPTFLPDGRVRLKVSAERTFLSTPNDTGISFDIRVDTTKTKVDANVVMDFNESLILSGLSEKETERNRDGVPGFQDLPIIQYFLSNKSTRDFQKSVMIILTPRLPAFIHRSEQQKKDADKKLTADERVLSELQARYSDWFRPYPNWASVFHHMQQNSLYREFRTGDVSLEQWNDYQSHEQRFEQFMDFLFY